MSESQTGNGVEAKCSRCPDKLDTTGAPKWCKKCRAKYQKDYQDVRREMTESRGFAAGCSSMQSATAAYFLQYPSAIFSGAEVAHMIRKLSTAELGKSLEFTSQT